jgi:hypothetical protein
MTISGNSEQKSKPDTAVAETDCLFLPYDPAPEGLQRICRSRHESGYSFEVWLCSDKKEVTLSKKEVGLDPREVQRQIYFGYVEVAGQKPPEKRHHLTNRIEGKGMYWKQDTGIETLEFYASVASTNFVELTRHG